MFPRSFHDRVEGVHLEKDILVTTIRRHGVLLEHQALITVEETFAKLNKQKSKYLVSEAQVSRTLDLPPDFGRSIELDVYARVTHPTALHGPIDYPNREKPIPLYEFGREIALRAFLMFQCKGHSSDGFLLLRKHANTPRELQLPVYQSETNFEGYDKVKYACSNWMIESRETDDVLVVNWGYFYQGEVKKGIYPQDKDGASNKFADAIEQLNYSVTGLILKFQDTKFLSPKNEVWLPVPILLTNCKIVSMEIQGTRVSLIEDIPWAVYKNRFDRKYWRSHPTNLPAFDYFYVVNFQYLASFLEALLDFRRSFRYPVWLPCPIHDFKI